MTLWRRLALTAKSLANIHRPGPRPDIFVFAVPRGGSTWLMEILASQPGIKYFDEPLNPRRLNVRRSGLIPDYRCLMPESRHDDVIIGFLRELQAGRHGYMNPTPFRRNHRLFTHRAVFKIHEVEHLISRIERDCSALIVYLLRHPVPTSLSRRVLPRLSLFLNSEFYASLLPQGTLQEIRQVSELGTPLQQAVISWCYQNLAALRAPGPRWLFVTYEELVLNPRLSCELLLDRLQLTDAKRMLRAFDRAAANISMSHAATLQAMDESDVRQRRRRLVTQWRQRVSAQDLEQVAQVLALFGIDAYRADQALPAARYLHFHDTVQILNGAD